MSHENDDDKSHFEETKSGTSDKSTSSVLTPALNKEVELEATPAPGSNLNDVVEIVERGRVASRGSLSIRSSTDSQRTVSDAHDHQVPPHRSKSRHGSRSRPRSSARSIRATAVKVPPGQRRGLLARLAIIAEVEDPYDYSRKLKWAITFVVAIAGAAAPMGSALILPALNDISETFRTTATIVNLSVAMYMLSMSIFPLWWSSFSETLGRRTIYLTSFVLFCVFNVLAAVSSSIGMFVVMRTLSGGAAASVQAVGAGTIADVWEVKERGQAMGIFYLGPLCGPLISPILGGVLAQNLGWRSAQWFLAIFAAVLCLMILFCLPETLRHRVPIAAVAEQDAEIKVEAGSEKDGTKPALTRTTTAQSLHIKTRKYLIIVRRIFLDPLRIILYLRFPAVAMTVFYSSITFGTLYVLNISVQETFSQAPYNYTSTIVGLLYLPNSAGYFLASIFGGRWVDRIMHREARKAGRYDERGRLQFRPEDRMKENAWLGCILWPCAIMMYGWAAHYHISVAVPMVANFFFGLGSMIIFGLVTTMLTEFMPRKASNGVAINNFCRNIMTCIGVVVTNPLIKAIGNGWLFTGLGVIALVSGPVTILAFKKYGDKWRTNMDKKMEEAMGE
ncbi:mfs transporter ops2 [Acrodontium crateriforme]|uniref:Mfs transporter ops2 n=1 Tax=Acrodontium crateriforme TaxID=150365 RepID=A0AAQ3M5W3_9PEZI|nr:mfs transporter ops2 [Acrodontium crateriforme]